MRRLLGRHPFLLFGVFTLALFFGASALPPSSFRTVLLQVVQILIIPMYLVWDVGTILMHRVVVSLPANGWLQRTIGALILGSGVIPYLLADWWSNRSSAKSRTVKL